VFVGRCWKEGKSAMPELGEATIGVYTSALGQKALVREDGRDKAAGPYVQGQVTDLDTRVA